MVEKEDIRTRVEAGIRQFNAAGASLLEALANVESLWFEDAVADLQECRSRLDEAIDEYREALELSERGLETGLIKEGGEELDAEYASPYETGERLFDHLRRKADLEELFYDDERAWRHLESAAVTSDPLAGYTRLVTFVSRVRNLVDGLLTDIERGEPEQHLLYSGWRAMATYMRTKNFSQMLEFANRETRSI